MYAVPRAAQSASVAASVALFSSLAIAMRTSGLSSGSAADSSNFCGKRAIGKPAGQTRLEGPVSAHRSDQFAQFRSPIRI